MSLQPYPGLVWSPTPATSLCDPGLSCARPPVTRTASTDINECTSLSEPCRPGFSCVNTVGSYTCQRNPLLCGRGYHASQDGTKCVGEANLPPPCLPSSLGLPGFLCLWEALAEGEPRPQGALLASPGRRERV